MYMVSRAAAMRIAVAVAFLTSCTSADGGVDLDGLSATGARASFPPPARWPLYETYAPLPPHSRVRYHPPMTGVHRRSGPPFPLLPWPSLAAPSQPLSSALFSIGIPGWKSAKRRQCARSC